MTNKWPWVRLGEVLRHRKEFMTIDDLVSYKRPRVQLHAQGIVLRDEIQGAFIKTKTQQICKAGDFLVAEIDAKVGGIGIVPEYLDGSIVSSHYFLFDIDQSKLDRDFLNYFIRTPAFRDQVEAQGSTNYASIRPAHVLGYSIPLPSLSEQRLIVARIDEQVALIKKVQSYQQEVIDDTNALVGSLLEHFLKDAIIDGVLGDILQSPPRNGWSAACDNAVDGVPVLSLSAISGFHYRCSEFKRTSVYTISDGHFWLQPGDLLITRSNTPALVGHAAIYTGIPAPCIYPDLMMRLNTRDDLASRRFVWYWLQSTIVRDYIKEKAKGTSPTMKKISQNIVINIPFPQAIPISKQEQIVNELDGIFERIDKIKNLQLESIAERDTLLYSILDIALSGKL